MLYICFKLKHCFKSASSMLRLCFKECWKHSPSILCVIPVERLGKVGRGLVMLVRIGVSQGWVWFDEVVKGKE